MYDDVAVIHKYPLCGGVALNALWVYSLLLFEQRFDLVDEGFDVDVAGAAGENESVGYVRQL